MVPIASRVIVAALLPLFIGYQPLRSAAQQAVADSEQSRQSDQRFVGQWTFMVGKRTLFVLDFQRNIAQPFSGSFTAPMHFRSQDFRNFHHIQGPPRKLVITSIQRKGDALVLAVPSPDDNDTDTYEFTWKDNGHAELRLKAPGVDLPPLELFRAFGTAAVSPDWDSDRTYSTEDGAPSNPEMKRIYEEDQAVRKDMKAFFANGTANARADEARRQQVAKLLVDGDLHSAEDFAEAAFLFQHGFTPDDYLLAHTLAMVAVRKGDLSALWIASATLDRYLNSIKQPQIYGTQFHTSKDQRTTQEPYNRALISDALRKQLSVPTMPEQEKQRENYDKQLHPAN